MTGPDRFEYDTYAIAFIEALEDYVQRDDADIAAIRVAIEVASRHSLAEGIECVEYFSTEEFKKLKAMQDEKFDAEMQIKHPEWFTDTPEHMVRG